MAVENTLNAGEVIHGSVPVEKLNDIDTKLAIIYGVVSEAAGSVAVSEAVTTYEVPKIDTATSERLEALPADYREQVLSRYAEKYRAAENYIRAGKLGKAFRLPEMNAFVDKITALAPAFEYIGKIGQPSVEFFPKVASENGWDSLLSGHALVYKNQETTGIWRAFNAKPVNQTKSKRDIDTDFWGVVVIDTKEQPGISGISANGKRGKDVERHLKTLKQLPDAKGISARGLIVKRASASEAAIRGVQLSRLERGEAPLDPGTLVIVKENVEVGEEWKSVFVGFDPDSRKVISYCGSQDCSDAKIVVRASSER